MKDDSQEFDRRTLLTGALGAAAALGTLVADAQQQQRAPAAGAGGAAAAQPGGPPARSSDATLSTLQQAQPRLYRLESDVHDCEVTGKIPADLNGAFYRVGPDAQYKMAPGNIPFDGEGHVSMFRIKDGRVNYRSRFVRNDRYLAQEKAGRILFPMYRNPAMDDPSVKGLSRSTANTHIINHRNLLLSLKEDSPPSALNLLTLETVAPTYTFDNQLPSKTFTAHPKLDSHTGNMVAFGYESEGHGSNVVTMFEFTPQGRKVWDAKIQVPYVGMLHDFAVTENYIVFYVIPMTIDQAQMDRGGIHWSWDGTKPTYFGFVRRGGDGKDVRWIEGPTRSATHVMGAFDNKEQLIVDVEMSMSNPFPFMPMHDGSRWDPIAGSSHITRLTVDLSKRRPSAYDIEQMYPHVGALPRQDDRYNTVPYRYGFLGCPDPGAQPGTGGACYARFDHQNRTWTLFNAGTETTLAENVFAPKSQNAPEGSGYLMGLATRLTEGGRSDLVILDAERLQDGPVATVHLPMRAPGQVHGWWVPEWQMPTA